MVCCPTRARGVTLLTRSRFMRCIAAPSDGRYITTMIDINWSPHAESQILSDLTAFRAAQAAEQAAAQAAMLHIPSRMTVVI